MATTHPIRYGNISRESAHQLGFAPANESGGVINAGDAYLAALPESMRGHIVEKVDAATWKAALKHAEWLQEQCGL
jgi:hypothetical protein